MTTTERFLREPDRWGDDEVSQYLKVAHENSFATFASIPSYFARAIGIDGVYRKFILRFSREEEWLAGLFVLRTHSGFLGAVRAASSGQIPEAFMCMRGCLETAVYALHIETEPTRAQIWVDREDDEEKRRACRKEFTWQRAFSTLEMKDPKLGAVVGTLYDRSIDLGAHPNAGALIGNLNLTEQETGVLLHLNYLSGPTHFFQLALKSTLQVALVALDVFKLAVPAIYDSLGVTEELSGLRAGL